MENKQKDVSLILFLVYVNPLLNFITWDMLILMYTCPIMFSPPPPPDRDVCLIDFDQIEHLLNSPPVKYSGSFMYTGSSGTTVEQLNWKQFGITIYCILKLCDIRS